MSELPENSENPQKAVAQPPLVRPFVVSLVVIRQDPKTINTQNKLYPIDAVSEEEALGKAVLQSITDFPGHRYHTGCVLDVQEYWTNVTTHTPGANEKPLK